jgi:hypothetical protein
MDAVPDRRRQRRAPPAPGYVITCYGAEHENSPRERVNLATRLLNVSTRGAQIATRGRLRERLGVIFEIELPGSRERFRAKAVVRWSKSVEAGGRTMNVAGLQFMSTIKGRAELKPATPRPGAEPRRGNKRFFPREVEIVCLPRGVLKSLGLASNAAKHLKDLSLGGAQVVSNRKLSPGRRVELRLKFTKPKLVVEIEGTVKWCRRDTLSVEPRWLAGVRFNYMPDDSEINLKAIERAFLGGGF